MIRARCHPLLEPLLPKPIMAANALPDWFRDIPSECIAPSLGGETVRTLKHCPPVIDAMTSGILMPLACDLNITGGEIFWDWDPPILIDARISRAPVGFHIPEQIKGTPFSISMNIILKFINFWTLEAPDGWSLLFTHPLNREDLPFRTLSGLVDCDQFCDGYVHFPALWTVPDFEGILPKGTPIAQVFAIPRDDQYLNIDVMTGDEIARNNQLQKALSEERGIYRKCFRH